MYSVNSTQRKPANSRRRGTRTAQAADRIVDLRRRGESSAHSYAYHMLRALRPGQVFELVVEEDPRVLMDSVSLQLRGRIYWNLAQDGPPLWRVRVRPRPDGPAGSLMAMLAQDHERLDRLFAHTLASVNCGDMPAARAYFLDFSAGLRRHMEVENELLAPTFVAPCDPLGADPTATMLREHDQVLKQVTTLEACLEPTEEAHASEQLGDSVMLMALLSGTLAKHEHREEQNLFPHWDRALAQAPDRKAAQALLQRIANLLGEHRGG